MKNKKGMAMNMLVSILLTVIAFMLITGTIVRFMSKSDDVSAEAMCQTSVGVRAAATLNVGPANIKIAPLLCKTIDKEISGGRDEVKQQIAEKMAKCWSMFGEGRYKKDVLTKMEIFGGKGNCFQCYTMMVEGIDDYDATIPITSEEFADYLRNTKYPKINGTYLDYIQSYGGPGAIFNILTNEGIAPDRAYAIAFKPAKEVPLADTPQAEKAVIGTAVVGGILFLIPLGITQVIGGSMLVGAGAAAIATTVGDVADYFDKVPNLNVIYLVDMNQEALGKVFGESCSRVDDVAGD